MNVVKFFNKIPGPPEPIMYWNANRLTGADGSLVTSWQNLGTSGATYNLQMSGVGTNTATFHPRVGADRAHVAFAGSRLETLNPVPNTMAGLTSRTTSCLFKVASLSSANLVGYGDPTALVSVFDILFFGSGHLLIHYGGGQVGAGYPTVGSWVTATQRITDLADGTVRFDNYINGSLAETFTISNTTFNPTVSPFYVGQGGRTQYNLSVPTKIAAAYAVDRALTLQEMAHMRALMLELKPYVSQASNGDSYVNSSYHDTGYAV